MSLQGRAARLLCLQVVCRTRTPMHAHAHGHAGKHVRTHPHDQIITSAIGVQDIMRLDNSARLNTPGVAEGNWSWRVGNEELWEQLKPEAKALRALSKQAFRCGGAMLLRRTYIRADTLACKCR